MVPWPSGKARVCKTLIHQFKSGRHLQKIPGCWGIRDFLLFCSLNNLLSKTRSRKIVRFECLTILDKTYIIKARKVLSCKMVSSLLANQRNDRSGWEVWGGHFLCQSSELCFVLGLSRKTSLAIIHVTWMTPMITVARRPRSTSTRFRSVIKTPP